MDRFTYMFHVDFVGHITDATVVEALGALYHRSARLQFLGSWPIDLVVTEAEAVLGTPPQDRTEGTDWARAMAAGKG